MSAFPQARRLHPAAAPSNYVLERRGDTRWSVSGRATAVVTTLGLDGSHTRICGVELSDMSDRGLGVLCEEPLPVGSQISVFIGGHGAESGYDLKGTVVRCVEHGTSRAVGVRLRGRMAA